MKDSNIALWRILCRLTHHNIKILVRHWLYCCRLWNAQTLNRDRRLQRSSSVEQHLLIVLFDDDVAIRLINGLKSKAAHDNKYDPASLTAGSTVEFIIAAGYRAPASYIRNNQSNTPCQRCICAPKSRIRRDCSRRSNARHMVLYLRWSGTNGGNGVESVCFVRMILMLPTMA